MLKQWIHQIRLNPVHYGTSLWNYHLSGHVLDLFVESSYLRDKKKYREAVIKIGMVLQAITNKLDEHESPYLIQSFPSLEDRRIVASIRIDKRGETQNNTPPQETKSKTEPVRETKLNHLINFAESNQLQLVGIARPDHHTIPNVTANWYALCSKINNPFTWLKAGYWQEMATCIFTDTETDQELFIITDYPYNKEIHFLSNGCDNQIIQAIVAIQK